jgi:hypothetical protein
VLTLVLVVVLVEFGNRCATPAPIEMINVAEMISPQTVRKSIRLGWVAFLNDT